MDFILVDYKMHKQQTARPRFITTRLMHIAPANASASYQIKRLISVDINFITLPLRKEV